MYRTRIFLTWTFVAAMEFMVVFLATWLSLYVPKKYKRACEDGSIKKRLGREPLQIIKQRFYLNWPYASLLVALITVIVFGVMHYGEIVRVCFGGLWVGHLVVVFCLILCYVFLAFALIVATLMGEGGKEIYLENLYWNKYGIRID